MSQLGVGLMEVLLVLGRCGGRRICYSNIDSEKKRIIGGIVKIIKKKICNWGGAIVGYICGTGGSRGLA